MPSDWENLIIADPSKAKDLPLGEYGEYVARYLGDYAFQFSLALVAIILATAAWVIPRRRYVKSVDFKRGIDALRSEFRRLIDEVRAATARKATGISDNLLSISNQMDSSVTDLNVRLARLEEYADAIEAVAELDGLRTKVTGLEQRLSLIVDPDNNLRDDFIGNATPKPGSSEINEANGAGENASTFGRPTPTDEGSKEAS